MLNSSDQGMSLDPHSFLGKLAQMELEVQEYNRKHPPKVGEWAWWVTFQGGACPMLVVHYWFHYRGDMSWLAHPLPFQTQAAAIAKARELGRLEKYANYKIVVFQQNNDVRFLKGS